VNIRRGSVGLALVLALSLAPVLSGCSLNQIVTSATGGNLDLGGTELPSSFPAEVPLYGDDITLAAVAGNDTDGRAWNVSVRVASVDDADAIASQLVDAGFSPVDGSDLIRQTSDDGRMIAVENDDYGVIVVVAQGNDEVIANYTVTEKNDSGG
jgi:hypothetical protein